MFFLKKLSLFNLYVSSPIQKEYINELLPDMMAAEISCSIWS